MLRNVLRHVSIGENERYFLIRKGLFEDILTAGDYWIAGFGVELERHNIDDRILVSSWADFLIQERWELVYRHFTLVETGDGEVAVVYFDDQVSAVVGTRDRALFWRGGTEVTYDLIDTEANPRVPALLVPALQRLGGLGASGFWDPSASFACRRLPSTPGSCRSLVSRASGG